MGFDRCADNHDLVEQVEPEGRSEGDGRRRNEPSKDFGNPSQPGMGNQPSVGADPAEREAELTDLAQIPRDTALGRVHIRQASRTVRRILITRAGFAQGGGRVNLTDVRDLVFEGGR